MSKLRTLIDAETIQARVAEMGKQITEEYAGQEIVLIPVLKGSFVFAADLARAIDLPLSIEFLGLRSYGSGTTSSGVVEITKDLGHPVEGKHLIVVEDIVDTGLTMQYLFDNFKTRKPASMKLASLLHKPARSQVDVPIDYLGFEVEDLFVIGYGLDYAEKYRNLPYIGVLEQE